MYLRKDMQLSIKARAWFGVNISSCKLDDFPLTTISTVISLLYLCPLSARCVCSLTFLSNNSVHYVGWSLALSLWLLVIDYVSWSERSSKGKSSRATLGSTPFSTTYQSCIPTLVIYVCTSISSL